MRHTASQSYNVGTGKAKNGVSLPLGPQHIKSSSGKSNILFQIWARSATELAGLKPWDSKLRSWCEDSDPVCAQGSNVQTHGAYLTRFGQEIADWMRVTMGIVA